MLDTLARMLGLSRTAAEESLHSERAARHLLSLRARISTSFAGSPRPLWHSSKPPALSPKGCDTASHDAEASRVIGHGGIDPEAAGAGLLTRRDAFGLAGAMCAGLVIGEVPKLPDPYEAHALLNAIKAEMEAANRAFLQQWQRTVGGQLWTAVASFEADG